MNKYNVDKAIEQIIRCGGVVGDKTIRITLPGIRALGAIDYLCRCGYTWERG